MRLRIACRSVLLMADEIPAFALRRQKKIRRPNMRTRRWEFLSGNEGSSLAADCITGPGSADIHVGAIRPCPKTSAAMPSDVRKAFGLPTSALSEFLGYAQYWATAPNPL